MEFPPVHPPSSIGPLKLFLIAHHHHATAAAVLYPAPHTPHRLHPLQSDPEHSQQLSSCCFQMDLFSSTQPCRPLFPPTIQRKTSNTSPDIMSAAASPVMMLSVALVGRQWPAALQLGIWHVTVTNIYWRSEWVRPQWDQYDPCPEASIAIILVQWHQLIVKCDVGLTNVTMAHEDAKAPSWSWNITVSRVCSILIFLVTFLDCRIESWLVEYQAKRSKHIIKSHRPN